jgi:membrane protein DedA with SNARE-associated domain
MKLYGIVFAATIEFAVTIIAFYFLGTWLGNRYHEQWLALASIIFGTVFGFARLVWTAYNLQKDQKDDSSGPRGNA